MSVRRKQTAFIRKLIYTLKRAYGFTITLHKIESESLDYETGERTSTILTQKINRAVLLPAHFERINEQTSPNFKYGGHFDTSTRRILIDAKDLNSFKIEIDDYFVWNEKRWQISEFYPYEFDAAFILIVRMVEGTPRHMIEEIFLESNLQFSQEVEEE